MPTVTIDEIAGRIRHFIRHEVIPLEPDFLTHDFGELLPGLQVKRHQVVELGLFAPHMPPAYGGLGLSLPTFARVSEELGRSPLGHYIFNCQAPDIGNMDVLLQHGTREQQDRFLGRLARGEIRSCFAMAEPENAGWNPTALVTTAVVAGDSYVINGHKWFT